MRSKQDSEAPEGMRSGKDTEFRAQVPPPKGFKGPPHPKGGPKEPGRSRKP